MCKSERYFLILLVLFVAWMCVGIFPLQCYETDGNEIILGCDVMYRNGWSFPPVYSYEYRMQPLITILIVALKHLLPFLTCEQIYCVLTVVSSFVFLAGCITFARQENTGQSRSADHRHCTACRGVVRTGGEYSAVHRI